MNTTTASHAFFLLFVMAIAVVIDSTSATEHADVRRRTKAAKGSNPTKVCLEVYEIKGSTDLVSGPNTNNVCGYPPAPGTEDDYNACLTEEGFRAGPFVFNRASGPDIEFQFVTNEKYSTCGFNDSAFKGINKSPKSARLEYQADEFYGSEVGSITSIEYDVYCVGVDGESSCNPQLDIYTRAPDSSTALEGDYDCRLNFRTDGGLDDNDWHAISIDLDTVPTFTFESSVGGCPTSSTGTNKPTLQDLAKEGYFYGTYGTKTVGSQKIIFRWSMSPSEDFNPDPYYDNVFYHDNIRIQVEDEKCVRVYDM